MSKPYVMWLSVFVASVAFVGCLLMVIPKSVLPEPATDYFNYYRPVAENLRMGRGLVSNAGNPAIRYPPGHPLFLAAQYALADRIGVRRESVVIALSVLLHAGVATLLAMFASQFWSGKWRLLPAVLWNLYPPALWLIPLMLSETPFIPLFVGAVLCFWMSFYGARIRYSGFILSGTLTGLALLCRPAALPIPFILAAILLIRPHGIAWQKRLVGLSALLLSCLAIVMPWEIWMYYRCGRVELLSSGGLPSVIDGLTWAEPLKNDFKAQMHVSPDVQSFMDDLVMQQRKQPVTNMSQLAVWLIDRACHEPCVCLKILGYKMARSWYGTDSHRRENLLLLIQLPTLGLALAGAVRAWRCGGLQRELVILVLALVLGAWFMTVVALSIMRYMTPIMPLAFFLVTATFNPADARVQSNSERVFKLDFDYRKAA